MLDASYDHGVELFKATDSQLCLSSHYMDTCSLCSVKSTRATSGHQSRVFRLEEIDKILSVRYRQNWGPALWLCPLLSITINSLYLWMLPGYAIVKSKCTNQSIWNSIPLRIRSLPSLNSFKRTLKTHLFSLNSLWSWPCYTSASDSSLLEFAR